MRTLLIAGLNSLATAAILIAGFVMNVPGMALSAAAAQTFGGPAFPAQIPPEIAGLHRLSSTERFGHFLGGQFRFTDVNNASHVVSAIPGTVQSVAADSLVIKPNDASLGATKSYTLSSDTLIRGDAQSWHGGQGQSQITVGDTVVVVSMDSDQPRAVIVGGADGFGPKHRFGPRAGSQ